MGIVRFLREKLVTKYKAIGLDEKLQLTKSSLVKILSKEKIGGGKYGTVYNSKVKVGKKHRGFAIKKFIDQQGDPDKSVLIHKQLKDIGVPTWTTYRKLIPDNSLLMTLGNKDGSYLFSANNSSLDSASLKKNRIEKIDNINAFYESAYDTIKKLTINNRDVFFDAYMFKYKDNKMDLIVGDFDSLKQNEENEFLLENNIYEFCYALLRARHHFLKGDNIFDGFASFLIKKQNLGDPFLSKIDLNNIYNVAYRSFYIGSR
ncbi:MAG TPA: hypothetical protein P5155_03270 [Candidatus Absconditabacterales bacterium]|nr:hypothetical protein [Candidatus Absconditabacterales bacterium]